MKKVKIFAATAALLLSGGVFMKSNIINETLSENIQAFTQEGNYPYDYEDWSSGTCGYYANLIAGTEVCCNCSKDHALSSYNWYSWHGYTSYWCCDSCKNTFYCGN
ncbi:MAG: hypothetical protein J6U04_12840 [Salinivirgaceae bacterium]|nr:hypothetical protein [Salinivirgaceae bacterium]